MDMMALIENGDFQVLFKYLKALIGFIFEKFEIFKEFAALGIDLEPYFSGDPTSNEPTTLA